MDENDTTAEPENPSSDQHEVKFKYVKSNFFRVIHADGAWGGVSPRGNIHVSFYNERAALPDSSKLVVSDEGVVITPEKFHASSRVVRELECDVVFDFATAKSLQAWLNDKVKVLEGLIQKEEGTKQEGTGNGKKMAL